jgi:tRNA(fMet)-specific endonuclease VapC
VAATPRLSQLVLLDTDVLSHLLRNKGELSERYRALLSGHDTAVTFITVGEIYSGLYKRDLSTRLARFETTLRRELLLIPFSLDVCRAYGRLVFERTPQGSRRVMGTNDRWIASCALHHELPLVTHNVKHFKGVSGLTLMTAAS